MVGWDACDRPYSSPMAVAWPEGSKSSGWWAAWQPPIPRLPFPACGWRFLLPSSTVALSSLAHPPPHPHPQHDTFPQTPFSSFVQL